MNDRPGGGLDEMGWSEHGEASPLRGAATSAMTLLVGGLYWASLWMPFAYLALRDRAERRKGAL
jgi:hypothetical protein